MRHRKSSIVYTCRSYQQNLQTKKYFYVSLGNNFLTVFLWRLLSCGGPGQLPSLPPPLKSSPVSRHLVGKILKNVGYCNSA